MFDYIITALFLMMAFYLMVKWPIIFFTIFSTFVVLVIVAKILKRLGYLNSDDSEGDDK